MHRNDEELGREIAALEDLCHGKSGYIYESMQAQMDVLNNGLEYREIVAKYHGNTMNAALAAREWYIGIDQRAPSEVWRLGAILTRKEVH